MTTTVRLLFAPSTTDGLTPMKRFLALLEMKPDFDGLYTEILQPCAHFPFSLEILSTIALAFRPLSVSEIADLLDIKAFNVANVLIHLHTIMQVPDRNRTPITLWHTSLRDFLCTEPRSKDFYASPGHHRRLAFRAVRMAVSDHPSASREYSQHYAVDHLSKALGIHHAGDLFNGQGGHTIPFLEKHVFRSFIRPLGHPDYTVHIKEHTALGMACQKRDWNLVRALADTRLINVNAPFASKAREFALTAACAYGTTDEDRFLLERGADPNQSGNNDHSFGNSIFPLAFAIRSDDAEMVKTPLAFGADHDPDLKGNTDFRHPESLLHICVFPIRIEIACTLLEHGADVNYKDRAGRTPLSIACSTALGRRLAEVLVQFCADPNI